MTTFTQLDSGHVHMRPEDVQEWLSHHGFETLKQRVNVLMRSFAGTVRFVWDGIAYEFVYSNIGEFDWYDVRSFNLVV